MKKAYKIILEILKWASLVLIGLFAFHQTWNYFDNKNGGKHPLFGVKDTVIVTGSMSFVTEANKEELKDYHDQIQINDVITTTNRITYDSLNVYDVILFNASKGNICHRIIKKYVTSDGKKMLVTRGDANDIADAAIEYDAVIGKVIKIKPKLGWLINFINSPYFLLGLSVSVGCISIGILVASKDKKNEKSPQKPSELKTENKQEINEKTKELP